MALSSLGAVSLRTENMSTNSLKLRFPIPSSEKASTILLRNGFSYKFKCANLSFIAFVNHCYLARNSINTDTTQEIMTHARQYKLV